MANRTSRRRDTPLGGDLFCGGGGGAQGLSAAGIHVRVAANHDPVAIATHSANHPSADHFEVDLLAYDVAKLPAVDFLHASPSCVYFSQAKAHKAMHEPTEVAARAVRGEEDELEAEGGHGWRSRVLMTCPMRYAAKHLPAMLVVENVIDAAYWGPGRDGSTFRWWLAEWDKLGYAAEPCYLNSAAFGVPQMRDRMYVAIWRKGMRRPDLLHRIEGWCGPCAAFTPARQVFRPATPAWPVERWGALGRQWDYRCDTCDAVADIALPPAATAVDFADLGTRVGDRQRPLGASTLTRLQRMLDNNGGHLPSGTLNPAQQRVYGGALAAAPEGCVVPMRRHTRTTGLDLPCHTLTAQQRPAVAFSKSNGGWDGDRFHDAAARPFQTVTCADGTYVVADPPAKAAKRRKAGRPKAKLDVEDLRFRMLKVDEMRRIMAYADGFRFAGPDGRDLTQAEKVRLLGNGITPPVLDWLNQRMLAVL